MGPKVKHIRFSLANALRATAWLCVSAGCFSFLLKHSHHDPLPWPQWMTPLLFISLNFLMVWSPIVAVGALLGHTKRGMVAGLVFVVFFVLAVAWSLPEVQ